MALLELLVHLDVTRGLPRLVAFHFTIDPKFVLRLPAAALPRSWRSRRGLVDTRRVGDDWLRSGRAMALAVPSVLAPEELNYLLNPAHPSYARLTFGEPIPFVLDPRFAQPV